MWKRGENSRLVDESPSLSIIQTGFADGLSDYFFSRLAKRD